ncbi:PLDc N-terminal domain-containing protein [Streptomyces sasae]|uniref:PLDc N-terminal domain-containing protein n=1 Tax=Streptomyces sasae TaxID=1266772 RepID=UPI00292CEBE0|nr:PLDc N-terminal domain-containing protein [Streptomyces sasae]
MLADSLSTSPATPWVAIAPPIAMLPAVLCMIDIARHPNTRRLAPQVWLAVCAFGNVFGLIAYLKFGRAENR